MKLTWQILGGILKGKKVAGVAGDALSEGNSAREPVWGKGREFFGKSWDWDAGFRRGHQEKLRI